MTLPWGRTKLAASTLTGKRQMSLVQKLPAGPLDIIGDIHGEYDALQALLQILGYSDSGEHPQGRTLVFTGDLVDRGPDSPAVMEKIISLVESGCAHCVLGNHELNILRGVRKGGNDWMLDAGPYAAPDAEHVIATEEQAKRFRVFLNRQPFALVGPQLRVVHACWDTDSMTALRSLPEGETDIGALYRQIEDDIVDSLAELPVAEQKLRELAQFGDNIADRQWSARLLPAHADVDIALQMRNPLRVLTTSAEKIAAKPFWAGGKWRMTERSRWWESYTDDVPVVIGHFWRLFDGDARRITGMFGADVFEGIAPHEWMGCNRNVYCVDYAVGQRHLERREQRDEFHGKLAAMRFPEWEVVHDDGSVVSIGEPG